jgi:hypothetical protein
MSCGVNCVPSQPAYHVVAIRPDFAAALHPVPPPPKEPDAEPERDFRSLQVLEASAEPKSCMNTHNVKESETETRMTVCLKDWDNFN